MWVACMKREMELMIVSGYQLHKLYRLIKIRTIHSFFQNRTTHNSQTSPCDHMIFVAKSSPMRTQILRRVTDRLTVRRLVNINPG
jgi:trehalose/maltose hydrolase-like predicted phosphorylase